MCHSFTMNCIQFVTFVLQLALLHSIQSKKICDFADIECTTRGAHNVYKSIVSGIQGVVESSDPLHLREIVEETPSLKYKLTNATLAGMANCQVTLLKLHDEELTYQYDLLCPQLVLNHNYNVEGLLGTAELIGKGSVTITLNDYTIVFKGKYGKFISEKDQKLHFFLKKYNLEFEPKRKIIIDIQGPLHSDKTKSDLAKTYIIEHLDEIEHMLRYPTLESYMALFYENADAYLRFVPVEEILLTN